MKEKIHVITKIPDPKKQGGNLCDEQFVLDIDKMNKDVRLRPFGKDEDGRIVTHLPVKLEVFHLGEIIIVDEKGREIGGWFRKAEKWHIEYKEFEMQDMEKAIKLSRKIMGVDKLI